MSFCSNCGSTLEQGAKFCNVCGKKVSDAEIDGHDYNTKSMMCPHCGAVLRSFSGKCQYCGVELSGLEGSESIKQFSQKLAFAGSDAQRINLIKGFPIPNTKEDILEYMIMASSNIGYKASVYNIYENDSWEEFEEAWIAKLMQSYQKAKLIYEHDDDFIKVKKIYNETMARIENADREKEQKKMLLLAAKNAGAICGIIAAFIALFMNLAGNNSSLAELLAVTLLIISACTLKKRNADYIESGIAAVSGFLLIALSFWLDNGSMFELGGVIVLISVAVNFFSKVHF